MTLPPAAVRAKVVPLPGGLSAAPVINTVSQGNFGLGVTLRAVAGGVGSVIGGGKFGNGAVTGAFGYLFSPQAQASLQPGNSGSSYDSQAYAYCVNDGPGACGDNPMGDPVDFSAPGAAPMAAIAATTVGVLSAALSAMELLGLGGGAAVEGAFETGQLVERTYTVGGSTVGLLGEAEVSGTTLDLTGTLGTRTVLQMFNNFAAEVRAAGYQFLRISGVRYSGADPGKAVDITRSLVK